MADRLKPNAERRIISKSNKVYIYIYGIEMESGKKSNLRWELFPWVGRQKSIGREICLDFQQFNHRYEFHKEKKKKRKTRKLIALFFFLCLCFDLLMVLSISCVVFVAFFFNPFIWVFLFLFLFLFSKLIYLF